MTENGFDPGTETAAGRPGGEKNGPGPGGRP